MLASGLLRGLHRHLQRHPHHVAALLPLVREPLAGGEPLEARVVDGGREVEQRVRLRGGTESVAKEAAETIYEKAAEEMIKIASSLLTSHFISCHLSVKHGVKAV